MTALEPTRPVARELAVPDGLGEEVARAFLLGYSTPNTRTAYARDLSEFFRWCNERGVNPLAARRARIDAFARDLEGAGRAKATVARKLAVLSKFYKYAVDEELIDRSPLTGIHRPRVPQESQTLGLDRGQATRLLNAAEAHDPTMHALTALLVLNGLRVSEACALDVTSFADLRGHRVVTVHAKGGEIYTVPLAPRAALAVAEAAGGRQEGPVLLHRRERLTRQQAFRDINRLARVLGMPGITPHSLRHTAATMALDAGVPLRDVQTFMRHKDPKTTIRYDRARKSLDGHATYAVGQWLAGD